MVIFENTDIDIDKELSKNIDIVVQIPPGWWRVMENMASYSALGEYGLWKNLKFGEAKPSRISNFSITHILQVQNMNAIFSMTRHQPGGICD